MAAAVTAFSPPPSCNTWWFGSLSDFNGYFGTGVQCPRSNGKLVYDNNCYPTSTQPISAGCPVGFAAASSGPGTVGCCPTAYKLVGGMCSTPVTASWTFSFMQCYTDNAIPKWLTGSVGPGYNFFARPVYLTSPTPTPTPAPLVVTSNRVVTSDRVVTSNVVVTSNRVVTVSQSAASSPPAAPSISPAVSGSTQGPGSVQVLGSAQVSSPGPSATITDAGAASPALSKGAVAGIAVGAVGLIAIAGFTMFFLLRRRRKQKEAAHAPPMTNSPYPDTKSELAATGGVAGAGYGHNHGREMQMDNKHVGNNVQEKSVGMATIRPPASSPPPPSELSATVGTAPTRSYPTSPATQHSELPSYAPGGQPYNYTTASELSSTSPHQPQSQYVETTGPYYPEAYIAPISADQARASRLAELESSQRDLEARMLRMRHMSAMEEEYERTQAEIARLRSGQA